MRALTRPLALIVIILLLGFALPALAGDVFPYTVADVRGTRVTISHLPRRIISLAPNNTEILYALGVGSRLIAATDYCDYPPAAAKLPRVGGYLDPSVEKVVALKPDLVLATRGTRRDLLDRLSAFRFPVVCLDPESLPQVCAAITTIGRCVGATPQAVALVKSLRARQQAVTRRTSPLPVTQRPMTLFLFDLNGLYSIGPGSHIDTMLRDAGGRNVGATAKTPWPQLSMETVIAANPSIILLVQGSGMGTHLTPAKALAQLRADKRWTRINAVKRGRLYLLEVDALTLPGPRMVDGLESIARILHPALFPTKGHP